MTPVPPSSPLGGSRPGAGSGAGHTSPTPTGFIGRYQILEKIGEGGMGSLYLARDPAIDRLVAIKLLRRGFDTEAVRERFAREARAAGRLRHPNIVTIFDVGEHDGDPFIAMEFLAGETLAELVRQGAGLTLSRRVKLLEELCDGLAYAHRAGLVHRDIKPANLMVDAEGVLKILDFGIVRVSDSGVTQAGVLVGTINYMSPEQVLGTGVDHRSDIFAVGLVAYELLTGRQAFPGTMKDGLLKRIPNAEIEPLTSVLPSADPEVAGIVEHALKKEPADRYQELARMRNDLARVRMRIEAEEERAAASAISSSAETALISEEPTAAGVVLQPPRQATPEFLVDAERALAEGNYRFALTIAGRAAAMNPVDRYPSSIVARAEAGLLDRGRAFEANTPPKSRGSGTGAPASTVPVTPSTAGGPSRMANFLAIAVAVMALIVAGFAVWSQMGGTGRDRTSSTTSDNPSAQVPDKRADASDASANPNAAAVPTQPGTNPGPASSNPDTAKTLETVPPPAATPPDEAVERSSGRPGRETAPRRDNARGSTSSPRQPSNPAAAPSSPSEPAGPVRAGTVVPAPAVVRRVPATYPPDARNTGAEGSVTVEVTVGTDGRVTDARVLRSIHPLLDAAALAAARQWTFQPSTLNGRAVPVLHSIDLAFTAPEPIRPPSSVPGTPRSLPTTPPPPVKAPDPPKEASPSSRDPRAVATAEVRDILRRYQAAREARSIGALREVQRLSTADANQLDRAMRETRELSLEMSIDDVQLTPDLRRATAAGTYKMVVRPPVGDRQTQSGKVTFELENIGERWWIASVRW
jgi:TonB family protein